MLNYTSGFILSSKYLFPSYEFWVMLVIQMSLVRLVCVVEIGMSQKLY
nr:MAG TPA: hypothetical protein [Caudoviricetes sp.]